MPEKENSLTVQSIWGLGYVNEMIFKWSFESRKRFFMYEHMYKSAARKVDIFYFYNKYSFAFWHAQAWWAKHCKNTFQLLSENLNNCGRNLGKILHIKCGCTFPSAPNHQFLEQYSTHASKGTLKHQNILNKLL